MSSAEEAVELKSIKLQPTDQGGRNDGLGSEVQKSRERRRFLREVRKQVGYKESHSNPSRSRMFGIKCNFGTDDFFFLSLFAVAIKAAW